MIMALTKTFYFNPTGIIEQEMRGQTMIPSSVYFTYSEAVLKNWHLFLENLSEALNSVGYYKTHKKHGRFYILHNQNGWVEFKLTCGQDVVDLVFPEMADYDVYGEVVPGQIVLHIGKLHTMTIRRERVKR